MLRFPNAKINIGLHVTRKRQDGYHDLETIFYPVPVYDALEILPAKAEAGFHGSGLPLRPDPNQNLVWKAYTLLQRAFPDKLKPSTLYLYKNIPMGAGLGGGSADAAFMLQMLNDYYKLDLDRSTLLQYALQLGSDCPFFLGNKPAYAEGRGEKLVPVQLDLSGYSIQIICPGIHVSTAEAFSEIRPQAPATDLRSIDRISPESWKDYIRNDFEEPVFARHPALAAWKTELYRQGAVYASMSGSGSAIYGLFPKGRRAKIKITSGDPVREFYA